MSMPPQAGQMRTNDIGNAMMYNQNCADAFNAILDPKSAAAQWSRTLSPDLAAWLDGLMPEELPQGRAIVHRSEIKETLEEFCDHLGSTAHPQVQALIQDAQLLAEQFAVTMGAEYLRLKFNAVSSNSCKKFHKDWIKARLVCTYRGTGTQYGVGSNGNDPTDVSTLAAGVPILLRGKLWPEQPETGFLHRSPPIEGTGETRLLFVVDLIDDPSVEV